MIRFWLAALFVLAAALAFAAGFTRGVAADTPRPALELTCYCAHGDEIFRGEAATYRRLDYDVFELQDVNGAELEIRGFCQVRVLGAQRAERISGEGFSPMQYGGPVAASVRP